MASPSAPKKRATNAALSPVERDSKRVCVLANHNEEETAAMVPEVIATSDSIPVTTQPVCATLVCGYPPVWAQVRQHLCEAQPHFRSHQAGQYNNGKVAQGFYISKYSEPRDLLDRNVLITCV